MRRKQIKPDDVSEWTCTIGPVSGWFDVDVGELWQYRDLILLFVKRDFVAIYKQTILGPLWYLIQPLMTTLVFAVIFNQIAKLSTDGMPALLFYLSGVVVWRYFADCLQKTANTFVGNASLFGKVYFPASGRTDFGRCQQFDFLFNTASTPCLFLAVLQVSRCRDPAQRGCSPDAFPGSTYGHTWSRLRDHHFFADD